MFSLANTFLFTFLIFLYIFLFSFAGKPTPYIMWYKNDKLLSNVTVNATRKNDVTYYESVITVRRLQRSDLKSHLTCAASNTHLQKPITTSVEVDMNCKYGYGILWILKI